MSEQNAVPRDDADGGRLVRLTIPAKPEYITLSRLALSGLSRVRALPDDTLADLKLALTEACSNSVRHAYGEDEGHVDISFELRDDRLIVEVADDGSGFEPDVAGSNGDDELSEGGLGIAIIRSIADEVEIGGGPGGRGSRLRFVKLL
ncbi:MAG: serine/threonine-protein kinase RsbW [Gaiellaceae bacterium]|jgi:serine/threonine-protein kinase RsbW|nr:serine/threonine-protein kinase RsbW [Gaiellaceae bacterium]